MTREASSYACAECGSTVHWGIEVHAREWVWQCTNEKCENSYERFYDDGRVPFWVVANCKWVKYVDSL